MTQPAHMVDFVKMHGLGNDFVIIDARATGFTPSPSQVKHMSDRRQGAGCDQLIILRTTDRADVFMEIWNADGTRAGACGNATRCVGRMMLDETKKTSVSIETDAGLLSATAYNTDISVNMGPARTKWHDIPLMSEQPTNPLSLTVGPLQNPTCVNMGNPHAVFFSDDCESIDLARWGAEAETHSVFPERANISVATVTTGTIRLRVWERGAGITEACGSAACAATVAASMRGLIDRKANVQLDGGMLSVEWLKDGTVQMTGGTSFVYSGRFSL